MPKRINPIAQYLICLAMTILAYSMYAHFAIPFIEGPPNLLKQRSTPRNSEKQPADRKHQYQHLFPEDAWELGTSNMLQTPQGKILFQDYQTQPDGTLIVFPFTMIMEGKKDKHQTPSQKPTLPTDQQTDAKTPPTVLRCLQEARIKFDRPFTLSGANQSNGSGRMESATLSGDVIIYRPPSSPQQNDSLRIETSNIQIDKQNIYTLEDVEFQLGPNCGRGRNLTIQMAHTTPVNSITADISKVKGIRRVELAFLDFMRIVPSRSGDHPTTPDSTNPAEFLSGDKSPLEITCKGPFVFDFDKKIVTLRDRVVVKQLDQFEDNLHCEELRLALKGAEQPTTNPISDTSSDMRLK